MYSISRLSYGNGNWLYVYDRTMDIHFYIPFLTLSPS